MEYLYGLGVVSEVQKYAIKCCLFNVQPVCCKFKTNSSNLQTFCQKLQSIKLRNQTGQTFKHCAERLPGEEGLFFHFNNVCWRLLAVAAFRFPHYGLCQIAEGQSRDGVGAHSCWLAFVTAFTDALDEGDFT